MTEALAKSRDGWIASTQAELDALVAAGDRTGFCLACDATALDPQAVLTAKLSPLAARPRRAA